MTNEQKTLIITMRAKGHTFNAIAERLELSVSTIKSYYQKASRGTIPSTITSEFTENHPKMSTAEASHVFGVCRHCGAPLEMHNGNHMKRFCSENCRQKWWRAHPGTVIKRASTSVCAACGGTFKNGGNHSRRYCSRSCYCRDRFGDGRYGVNAHG